MPKDVAPTPTVAPTPPALGAAGSLGVGMSVAVLIATVTTIYEIGAHFELSFSPREIADIVGTWLVHLGATCAMLWIIYAGFRRAAPRPVPGWPILVVLVIASALTGWTLHVALTVLRCFLYQTDPAVMLTGQLLQFLWLMMLTISIMMVAAVDIMSRTRATAATLHEVELGRLQLEGELAAARLQLLQAQAEPHFIFNSLANVRRLLRTDPQAARGLTSDLLRYLEEALPALRSDMSTLGREAQLVRAYLAVHQVRMGRRLGWDVDIPAQLADLPMPPMVLLTLVENALKHGLQPMVDGGTVHVAAQVTGGRVTLTVADTGSGMGSGSGQGTGLANVRARLRSMYGSAASLALAVNEPSGVVATVSIPAST